MKEGSKEGIVMQWGKAGRLKSSTVVVLLVFLLLLVLLIVWGIGILFPTPGATQFAQQLGVPGA